MRTILTLTLLLTATTANAQGRPSTTAMSCGQASGLVAAQGAVVLGTGGYTFDRFVRDRSFCEITEATERVLVQTRDTPVCFVGYRCYEPTRERRSD